MKNCGDTLIISHINPDPDTIGSAYGLKLLLTGLGKKVYMLCDTPLGERICGFFGVEPELDKKIVEDSGFIPETVICIDVPSIPLIGSLSEIYGETPDAVIDHHYTNTRFGRFNYIDETAAAAGEIICELYEYFGVPFDELSAKVLYCAIVCDSGSFKYSSTTPKTMNTAAKLIATGFDFSKLCRMIFQNKSLTQVKIERLAYNSLEFFADGKIAVISITNKKKFKAGLYGTDIDGISEIPKIIAGVEVGFTMKEKEAESVAEPCAENIDTGEFRISLRSNEYVNVAEIAAKFGGGGHIRASGCMVSGSEDEVKNMIIGAITMAL